MIDQEVNENDCDRAVCLKFWIQRCFQSSQLWIIKQVEPDFWKRAMTFSKKVVLVQKIQNIRKKLSWNGLLKLSLM